MSTLQKEDLKLVKVYTKRPPEVVYTVMTIVIVLFQNLNRKQDIWKQILALLGDTQTDQCVMKFHQFDAENLPRDILQEVEAMIEDTGYDFSYEHFQNSSKVAAKFVQWINGVITIARCRYVLDDLSNNINKLELKIKKFGKASPMNNMDNMPFGVLPPGTDKIYLSPRRSSKMGSFNKGEKGSVSPAKNSALKNKKAKEIKMMEIRYPYDDRLPSMISPSIDDFISSVAERKAKDLCDTEATEL